MVCCRCNRSGKCRNCVCVKQGRACVDCLPSRQDACCNTGSAPALTATSAPSDSGCVMVIHANINRARRAVEDGQYRKALQFLSSTSIAPSSREVLNSMSVSTHNRLPLSFLLLLFHLLFTYQSWMWRGL